MNEQCDKSSFSIFSDRQVWVVFQNEINAGDFTTFTRFFYKKPVYKQPSTRHAKHQETFRTITKKLRNCAFLRQTAHWNHYLVQCKTEPMTYPFQGPK